MKKLAFSVTMASGAAALLSQQESDASTQHTVESGESLWTIAQKYNTTADSIKQENNLTSNMLFPGQVITVGGESSQGTGNTTTTNETTSQGGSTHTVLNGESLQIIANQYGVSAQDIISENNLNGYLIHPGQELTIPGSGSTNTNTNTNTDTNDTELPGNETGSNGDESEHTNGGYETPIFNHQNLYTWGQCTWHVFNRRAQTGKPISTYWWNADHWAGAAQQDGYTVDNNPEVGSIMQNFEGPVGHVAYVERVNPDGSLLISEMNYHTPPGVVDYRTIPASEVASNSYIH
ncbi:CHAP domain-containing protein [Staphylococcus massiliensis]|uniref:Putative peptidoglycan hydrolase n=1 Tax=Staphylococcus massiliensis S46 TaxID=1229783 RepID=K9B485_9STAP|nr:CHAP domain-containing protein [Staphylococcus massiliensis]EKU48610.1 putative peptidoglycan hydrolase [Staphylococcus massiliensis S46]PNZ98449.1 LysM peptidoglycan-binding domain-containing protein [Staphylococcus massiliensis CCUG 55927]